MKGFMILALLTLAATHRPFHDRTGVAFFDEPTTEEDFQKYAQKGGALMCGLHATDENAGYLLKDPRHPPSAASAWNGDLQQEMSLWYWRQYNPASYSCDLNTHWQFSGALQALGLNGEKFPAGDNRCYRVEHWDREKQNNGKQVPSILQWYNVDGKDYQATEAHYEFGINTKGGAIYSFYLLGPKHSASGRWYQSRKDPAPEQLPQLRALSDVLWGYWNRDNPNIRNIRYFFMVGISNDVTIELIASCLQKSKKELKEWPGAEFSTSSDEGHALLGSPNGAAFAYFLIQHKAHLGYKTITKITVIRPENDDEVDFVDPTLVFHVEDMPEPPSPDDHKPGSQQGDSSLNPRNKDSKNPVRVHRVA